MAGFAMKPLINKNVCFLGDWSRVRFLLRNVRYMFIRRLLVMHESRQIRSRLLGFLDLVAIQQSSNNSEIVVQ